MHHSLAARTSLLHTLRQFFAHRKFAEVATPIARVDAIAETHIDLLSYDEQGRRWYLQASPELSMKELLCQGAGAIYQICPAFRAGDFGRLHRPEFTMVEWYRPGDTMHQAMRLLGELACCTLACDAIVETSYAELFERRLSINPHRAELGLLRETIARELPTSVPAIADSTDRDLLLNVLLSQLIEPELGMHAPQIVYHYPAGQAALAQTTTDSAGEIVAERFELYYRGIELANGYHELTDAVVMRRRLEWANAARRGDGRTAIPLPERLLSLMQSPGLPRTSGVALGFDRLLMLQMGRTQLDEWP